MKCSTIFLTLAIAAVLATIPLAGAQGETQAQPSVTVKCKCICTPPADQKDVDIAICLDTSGSMDGLIESAKQKIMGYRQRTGAGQAKTQAARSVISLWQRRPEQRNRLGQAALSADGRSGSDLRRIV